VITARNELPVKLTVLNCFSCTARFPVHLETGGAALLLDTGNGLILVDTGPGEMDYRRKPLVMRSFQLVTHVPLDPEETALRQIRALGYEREDVRDIVLTHMHFDHCGGIPDFPDARVHVLRREYEAFLSPRFRWMDGAYVRRHASHGPHLELYDEADGMWMGFSAIRVRVEPEMYLIPLPGHTAGHCGVALETEAGWHFHLGDAAPAGFDESIPEWFVRLVVGPHVGRLRAFRDAHPEIRITTGHMLLGVVNHPGSSRMRGGTG